MYPMNTLFLFPADCNIVDLDTCWVEFLEPLGFAFDNDGDADATCGSVLLNSQLFLIYICLPSTLQHSELNRKMTRNKTVE